MIAVLAITLSVLALVVVVVGHVIVDRRIKEAYWLLNEAAEIRRRLRT